MTEVLRRLPRTSPEAAGVDRAALERLVAALDERGMTHSLMVLRHGAVVAEQWWFPHAPEQRHLMYSVSKTFTAMAVGLAVADGLLTVEDRVVDLLADDAPAEVGENLAAMRVRHLLTMTSGHAGDALDVVWEQEGTDWPRVVLAAEVPFVPGSRYVYNSGATYLLSVIVTRLTGKRVLDYLGERVLAPLGITGAVWEQDPAGNDMGGYGLAVTTEDMAIFGQLLLQRGRWGDAQLVPAGWVDVASSNLVDNSSLGWATENHQGYGYQIWQCRHGAYRADGAHGQFIIVWPRHDAVLAITSGTNDMQATMDAVWDTLVPAFGPGEADAPGDPLPPRTLALPLATGQAWTAVADLIEGRTYALDVPDVAPPPGVQKPARSVTVHRDADGLLTVDLEPLQVVAAHQAWNEFTSPSMDPDAAGADEQYAGGYAWTDERTLELRIAAPGTPFVWTATLAFAPDGSTVEAALTQNVSFFATDLLHAAGRAV